MRQKKMLLFTGQFFLVSIVTALLIPAVLHAFLYLEQSGFFPPSDLVLGKNLFVILFINALMVSLFVNFGFCGLRFHEESMKLHEALVESQLQLLQQQISPHFMFNVLNHINILMREDVSLASALLIRYAKILRYQLDNDKNKKGNLGKDVQFLQDFVEIQKIRWGEELDICCSWKMENCDREFPPLLLITFIENAFKHVSRGVTDKAYVDINFIQTTQYVCLNVKNSKSIIQRDKYPVSGIGLLNVKKRLDILYGANYDLTVEDSETTYYTKLHISL
ncbi:hypothetical protein GCM10023313_20740 [Mucilaginibacter defluvii]|uniref:Signal transduction histidine kinase internal region domain-containing protein n=2 Tax=Mucilaginibacter defluvii TaxID=1196019 RepID=A0ABP9FTQ8_9SPHI